MKIVLVYDSGDEYHEVREIKEFENKADLIAFVNSEGIGGSIEACYEVYGEIKIEPFEKVTEYRIEE